MSTFIDDYSIFVEDDGAIIFVEDDGVSPWVHFTIQAPEIEREDGLAEMFLQDFWIPRQDLDGEEYRFDEVGPAATNGTSEDSIQRLEKVEVVEEEEEEEEEEGSGLRSCVVCLDEIFVGTTATRMPCLHVFHHHCIVKWLTDHNTCPVCRHSMPTADA